MSDIFIQPQYDGNDALLDAIARNDTVALPSMIIATALYESDFDLARRACITLSEHPDEIIRGNAILGFGHLARRFGELEQPEIGIVKRGLHDASDYVRDQANAAASDLKSFLAVDVRTTVH
jgi:hypothetical protein